MRVALAAVLAALTLAPAAEGAVEKVTVGTFDEPVYVTAPPYDTARVVVVQRGGSAILLKDGVKQGTPFLDLGSRVESGYEEQGLLSIAFAPDYATSRKVYAFYTSTPSGALQVDELTADPSLDHVDPGTRRSVITIPHADNKNHNGGQLQFGPDGMLWIGTGDGGGGGDPDGNGQNTHALLAKILRVDPRPGNGCGGGCTIPADNPFADGVGGAPEVWAFGLRNPWRFSFDRGSHDLWIGDVGQNCFEEVDHAPAPALGRGANYEWNLVEGFHVYEDLCGDLAGSADRPAGGVAPVIEYKHTYTTPVRASVTGGYVVRDPNLPSLFGRYVYGDFQSGEVWSVHPADPGHPRDEPAVPLLAAFGEDGCARLYAASLANTVYRFAETGASSGDCAGAVPPVWATPGDGGGGGGSGGPAGGGPGGPGAGGGPDTVAPVVRLRTAKLQRPWRSPVVRVTVQCNEQCAILARAVFRIRRGKRAGAAAAGAESAVAAAARVVRAQPARRTLVAGAGEAARVLRARPARRTLAGGARISLALKVSASTRRALQRALRRHRRVTVRFTVTATDRAGNRRTTIRSSRIALPKRSRSR